MSNLVSFAIPHHVRISEQSRATLDALIEARNPVIQERIIVERALEQQERARLACANHKAKAGVP